MYCDKCLGMYPGYQRFFLACGNWVVTIDTWLNRTRGVKSLLHLGEGESTWFFKSWSYFRPKMSFFAPVFRPEQRKNHPLWGGMAYIREYLLVTGITRLWVRRADHSATLPSLKSLMDASSIILVPNYSEICRVQSIKKISTNLCTKLIAMVWWTYRLEIWSYFRKLSCSPLKVDHFYFLYGISPLIFYCYWVEKCCLYTWQWIIFLIYIY